MLRELPPGRPGVLNTSTTRHHSAAAPRRTFLLDFVPS